MPQLILNDDNELTERWYISYMIYMYMMMSPHWGVNGKGRDRASSGEVTSSGGRDCNCRIRFRDTAHCPQIQIHKYTNTQIQIHKSATVGSDLSTLPTGQCLPQNIRPLFCWFSFSNTVLKPRRVSFTGDPWYLWVIHIREGLLTAPPNVVLTLGVSDTLQV